MIPGLGQGKYKMSLKHLVISEKRGAKKRMRAYLLIHSEEAANSHSWNNVNLKINNEFIGLYLRKPNKQPQIHIHRGRKREDGYIVQEGQLFLTEKSQLIDLEGMGEMQKHHQTKTTVVTVAGKIHKWMLK